MEREVDRLNHCLQEEVTALEELLNETENLEELFEHEPEGRVYRSPVYTAVKVC